MSIILSLGEISESWLNRAQETATDLSKDMKQLAKVYMEALTNEKMSSGSRSPIADSRSSMDSPYNP